jgi:hypothetical protein
MNEAVKICRECGAEFTMDDRQIKFYEDKDYAVPVRCPDCRKKKRQMESIPCKDCGTVFFMNGLEMEWYEKQGLKLPHRCPDCRRKRREANGK